MTPRKKPIVIQEGDKLAQVMPNGTVRIGEVKDRGSIAWSKGVPLDFVRTLADLLPILPEPDSEPADSVPAA